MKADLELRTRTPRSPAILACGAFAAIAFLPWVVGADVTGPRLGASAALLGAALVLARSGLGDGRHEARLSRDKCRALVLTSGGAGSLYRADVELVDGSTLAVSEHADPAEVLWDVSQAVEDRAVPLRSTWGLPEGATPWLGSATRKAAPSRSQSLSGAIWYGQTQVGATVVGGATFVVLLVALMLASRVSEGGPIIPLSLILPAISVGVIFAVGAVLLSARVKIDVEPETLRVSEHVLGFRVRERAVALAGVTDFYAVSPTGSRPAHVLVFTREGPFAVRCEPELAGKLVRALAEKEEGP